MNTILVSKQFLRYIIVIGIVSICCAGAAQSGVVRDIPELSPQTSNHLNISLSLINSKRRNTLRPGRPATLQVTFQNTGPQRMQVLYSRVYRAGNLVIIDSTGKRAAPHVNTLSKYHLLEDDWHLLMPGQDMQLALEGSIEHYEGEKERKLIFDEIDFILPGPGKYTLYFVLRQDEPSRSSFVLQEEWTGCAVSNAVKINLK